MHICVKQRLSLIFRDAFCVLCGGFSGDVKKENRFVRAPLRLSSQPIRRPVDRPARPAIINPEDLKDLDELDNECEDGWAGQ